MPTTTCTKTKMPTVTETYISTNKKPTVTETYISTKKNPPSPTPKPISPPPPKKETCPIDTLKLGVCANVIGGLIGAVIGTPPKEPCCSLLNGLVDLEAAVCLCIAIKANILGINLNVPVDLSLLLNYCGKKVPTGFQCP